MTVTSSATAPVGMLGLVQNHPALWAFGQLVVNADRMLTESARTNAAAALQAERTRRAIWLAEADDWHRSEVIRLP